MKNISNTINLTVMNPRSFSIVFAVLLLLSCGGNPEGSVEELVAAGNLEAIKAKRKELGAQERELNTSLALLDSVIASKEDNANRPLVTTQEIAMAPFQHYLELQGDVQTRQNVLLFPEMAGTMERVLVQEGDAVYKGQLLARIDDGGMASGLAQLRTQTELAKTTFERQKRLWDQNIGSEIQYLQAKTQYESLQNQVAQGEAQLAKSVIRAPFSGIIDDIMIDEGSTVNPVAGTPAFRLVNLSDMYVEVDVPESYLTSVKEGIDVKIYIPVLGESFDTKIRQTGNFINPGNRSFSVEIPVPNKDGLVKPNLTAVVEINDYSKEDAILIPQSVVSENAAGEQYVYTVVDNSAGEQILAKKVIIELGKTKGDDVEVLSGLVAGDKIVVEGARSVRDNQEVNIQDAQ